MIKQAALFVVSTGVLVLFITPSADDKRPVDRLVTEVEEPKVKAEKLAEVPYWGDEDEDEEEFVFGEPLTYSNSDDDDEDADDLSDAVGSANEGKPSSPAQSVEQAEDVSPGKARYAGPPVRELM